jgi:hypothetical protein
MTIRARLVWAVLWVASLLLVGTLVRAQVPVPSLPFERFTPLPTPTVLSGGDIGFRVEALRGGSPIGRLVVRWNGQWVEPTGGVRPAAID